MQDVYTVWAVIAVVFGGPTAVGMSRASGWEAGLRNRPRFGKFEYFCSVVLMCLAFWGVGYLSHMYL